MFAINASPLSFVLQERHQTVAVHGNFTWDIWDQCIGPNIGWWLGVAKAAFIAGTKLLYVEPS